MYPLAYIRSLAYGACAAMPIFNAVTNWCSYKPGSADTYSIGFGRIVHSVPLSAVVRFHRGISVALSLLRHTLQHCQMAVHFVTCVRTCPMEMAPHHRTSWYRCGRMWLSS